MPIRDRRVRFFVGLWLATWLGLAGFSFPFAEPEFRIWERIHNPTAFRFAANRHEEMLEVGDLGYKTWVSALQAPRRAVFTTDRFGFRNPDTKETPKMVVIGDSFVAGASLSDEETLTAQLAERLGEPVYNFATQYLNGPALFLREPRFARDRPDVVVWAPVARAIRPRPLFIENWDRNQPAETYGARLARFFERLNRDNGLTQRFRFAYQGMRYQFRGHPWERTLPSGESVLVLDLETQGLLVPATARGVVGAGEMVVYLDRLFRKAGVRFIFCPIPESGTIYPEIFTEAERKQIAAPPFLDLLISQVTRANVEVVDLRPVFRANAWPYLYRSDDTHWNARAVKLATEVLAEQLQRRSKAARRDPPFPERVEARGGRG